jgi:hypothetical protein
MSITILKGFEKKCGWKVYILSEMESMNFEPLTGVLFSSMLPP